MSAWFLDSKLSTCFLLLSIFYPKKVYTKGIEPVQGGPQKVVSHTAKKTAHIMATSLLHK